MTRSSDDDDDDDDGWETQFTDNGGDTNKSVKSETQMKKNKQSKNNRHNDNDDDVSSVASSIEDWELWGTEEEKNKGRAARARAKMSPEARKQQVARDMTAAREDAAAAKMVGDKGRQRAAGQTIGALRQEMKELGMLGGGVWVCGGQGVDVAQGDACVHHHMCHDYVYTKLYLLSWDIFYLHTHAQV